jgi:hypothetical protein
VAGEARHNIFEFIFLWCGFAAPLKIASLAFYALSMIKNCLGKSQQILLHLSRI